MDSAPIRFDRSRYQTGLLCPRRRWYEYEYPNGTPVHGIRPSRLSLPLLIGSSIHAGLEHLLTWAKLPGDVSRETAVDDAVALALHGEEGFWTALNAAAGMEVDPAEDAVKVARDSAVLVAGLLRAWALRKLPVFLLPKGQFEVVEVEREDETEIASGIILMSRADALLRERETGDLYIQSFKTAASWDTRQEKANRYDVQGLSEAIGVEARYPEGIMGIRMEYLLKGRRAEWPEGSGQWVTFSSIVTGYKTRGAVPGQTRYAWSWDWVDPGDVNPATGRPVKRTLGYKAWERFWVAEEQGLGMDPESRVASWVGMLAAGTVQPEAGDPLERLFVDPVPYFRQPEHLNRLKRQMGAREMNFADVASRMRRADAAQREDALDFTFPMNSAACAFPSLCPYAGICWEGQDAEEMLRSGEMVSRKAHHATEEQGGGE